MMTILIVAGILLSFLCATTVLCACIVAGRCER